MKYSLERLTAPEPKWEFALVFIKGMDDPLPIAPKKENRCEWLRQEDILIIHVERVQDPLNMPSEGHPNPDGSFSPAMPGGLAFLECHTHIDEIVAINFYTGYTEADYKKAGLKAASQKELKEKKMAEAQEQAKSTILTAEGEDPNIAKEREELEKKPKSKMKKVD